MSHGKLREEKDCLNCGHIVEEHYCPNCGQQNIHTRQPFHYLFTHFVEDFTHYDGQFWGTLKNLLFKPGKLTNTYLEGKRQKFVPPVKLYIFISFVAFFMFAMFPPFSLDFERDKTTSSTEISGNAKVIQARKTLDSIAKNNNLKGKDSVDMIKVQSFLADSTKTINATNLFDTDKKFDKDDINAFLGVRSKAAYDSTIAKKPSRLDFIDKPFVYKFFELEEKGVTRGEILRKLGETSFHNLPKALFIYLPIFAFFLWIFHNKKKWWYFDHGIFTLHYFSFLLLTILLFSFLYKLAEVTTYSISIIIYLLMNVLFFYSITYFFIAHYKVYHTHGVISFIIGCVLFTLNLIAFLFLVIALGFISFLMIH